MQSQIYIVGKDNNKMQITTSRLILRKPTNKDAKDLAESGNEKTMSYFTWYIPYPFTVAKAKKMITWLTEDCKQDTIAWCIQHKKERKVMGIVDLYDIDKNDKKAKVGFWLGKQYRGQGFAKEAVTAILDYAFITLKLNKITADVLVDNVASNAMLKSIGFRKVGLLKKEKIIKGKSLDCFYWELINN